MKVLENKLFKLNIEKDFCDYPIALFKSEMGECFIKYPNRFFRTRLYDVELDVNDELEFNDKL